jgi:hypothetical protein
VSGDCPSGYDCVGNRCAPSAVDTIGPEGGMVVSPDHRLTVEVPPNALSVRVHLTIDLAEAWPEGALGPVFEVRPSGTTFASPVTFVYRYQAADVTPYSPSSLKLAFATGATWTPLSTTIDPMAGIAAAQTTHLSTYGLIGPGGAVSSDAGDASSVGVGRDAQAGGAVDAPIQ